MYEPAGVDPRVGDLSTTSTLAPEALARLAAMASQLATGGAFLSFVPRQETVTV
jgi:hypothetical protein